MRLISRDLECDEVESMVLLWFGVIMVSAVVVSSGVGVVIVGVVLAVLENDLAVVEETKQLSSSESLVSGNENTFRHSSIRKKTHLARVVAVPEGSGSRSD